MTAERMHETTERGCYIPLWDEATGEFHNGWVTFRPDEPFFVRLEIEDWPRTVVAPRAVLLEGLDGPAECLAKPDSVGLRVAPSSDGKHVLLGLTQGDLLLAVFRVPQLVLAAHLTGMYELVPMGEEMARIDWDALILNLSLP